MYHCCTQIYLTGRCHSLLELFNELPPLEQFTYQFEESEQPDSAMAASADAVFADLRGLDVREALETLTAGKLGASDLVILAEKEQVDGLTDFLTEISDIWTFPLPDAELRFRLSRWRQSWKLRKDLWEAQQYLDATINSVPNLVWYKTKDGIHEKVNDSFCQTVGKTKEQVQGQGHAYIWDVEQDDPACIESERIVMESRETCVSEEIVQTGSGDKRLLTTYKSPLYDLDGSVMGTLGVAIDVTQERAYEQEIIQKNIMLETMFTTMDCGIMCHTLDGSRVLSINRAALQILGYETQEEMIADGFSMVASSVLDEDKPLLRECIETLKKVGDSVGIEYRVRHTDGRVLHVMGNVKLIEENGELFYQRFLLDCTAQKLREQKERNESERRQMELVHALCIDYSLVCTFDLSSGRGSALRTSDCDMGTLDSIFSGELSLKDSMERYIETCVYVEDREVLRRACSAEHLRAELEEKKQCYVNYRTLCNGTLRYFQMKAVRTGGWEENHTIVIGVRNLDDETRTEMEKKSLLEDALSQANRANQAKSVFLSNMSHDIRTPMNAIVGFTSLAISHIDRKEQVEEYLKKILTSGNHLVSLINDVLDMSRIESGKMRLEETLCNLPDILHSLQSILQADVRAKQLELYVDTVDVMDEDIYCDKLRLNQVLLNLLSNAVKYTGSGGTISMRITEKSGAPEGFANYEFRVKDTGIGMSQEFVSHIFEPFERERNSTISGIQGTGLGMAITKNIVDMMHGSIAVESEQGVGTEFIASFTFRLPSGPKEVQTIPALENCRALVVDDDFNTCDSVTYMLQQVGMRAEWTMSGREAVLRTRQAVTRGDTYSVYVLDWLMPDMNGVEVARRIRQVAGDHAPIIVMTAYDWSEIEEEARDAGVTAFCEKPLFLSELRNCLHTIVDVDEGTGGDEAARPVKLHTGRILLAEDNELNQEIAMAILEEAGFSTEVAQNGQIAVEMLKQSAPGYYCLVLMDVQMPVMDGYAATRAIRALEDPELAGVPILAMTANAFEEDRQEALKCGMNGHIAKPININNLMLMLDKVLK